KKGKPRLLGAFQRATEEIQKRERYVLLTKRFLFTSASPSNPDPNSSMVAGSGTAAPVTSTGPVLPFRPMMSATKIIPRLFGAVRLATVVPATWNTISEENASDAPFPQELQMIPNTKF